MTTKPKNVIDIHPMMTIFKFNNTSTIKLIDLSPKLLMLTINEKENFLKHVKISIRFRCHIYTSNGGHFKIQ